MHFSSRREATVFLFVWTGKVTKFAGHYDSGLTRLDGEAHLVIYCNLPLRDEGQKGSFVC